MKDKQTTALLEWLDDTWLMRWLDRWPRWLIAIANIWSVIFFMYLIGAILN